MKQYICIDKIRDSNDVITDFVLRDESNQRYTIKKQMLKIFLETNRMNVLNLKLTSDGKIIDNVDYNKEKSLDYIIELLHKRASELQLSVVSHNITKISDTSILHKVDAIMKPINIHYAANTVFTRTTVQSMLNTVPSTVVRNMAILLKDTNNQNIPLLYDDFIKNTDFSYHTGNVLLKFVMTETCRNNKIQFLPLKLKDVILPNNIKSMPYSIEFNNLLKNYKEKLNYKNNEQRTIINNRKRILKNTAMQFAEFTHTSAHLVCKNVMLKNDMIKNKNQLNILRNINNIKTNVTDLYITDFLYNEHDDTFGFNIIYNDIRIAQLKFKGYNTVTDTRKLNYIYLITASIIANLNSFEYLLHIIKNRDTFNYFIYLADASDEYIVSVQSTNNSPNVQSIYKERKFKFEDENSCQLFLFSTVLIDYIVKNNLDKEGV